MSSPSYLWAPPPVASLPVRGLAERLPVNRLFFVGRNYHAHALEMGKPVDKAVGAAVLLHQVRSAPSLPRARTVPYPSQTKNYHFEMELVLAIGKAGFCVPAAAGP